MQLLEVEVEHVRVLRGPLRLQLAPGLNVLHGPNEVGKSTLVEAIWQGLVLPSRSETAQHKALRPLRDGDPRVRLRFEHGGTEYTVEKLFAGRSRGRCTLLIRPPQGPSEELSGPEAEERLRRVLGVGEPGRSGELEPRAAGYWPLLRVTQGRSGVDPSEDLPGAQADLASRLAALSGEVLAGAGVEDLLEQVRAEYLRHFTTTGKPKTSADAPLAQAERVRDQAAAELRALEQQRADHEQDVDRHGELSARAERLRAELPAHRGRLERAQQALEALAELRRRLSEAGGAEALAETRLKAAEALQHERERLAHEARTAAAELGPRAQLRDLQHQGVQEQQALLPPLEAEHRAALHALAEAERRARRARLGLDLLEATARLAEAERLHAQLGLLRGERQQVEQALASERLRPDDLGRLEALESAAIKAQARLEAAAATLELEALAPCGFVLEATERRLNPGPPLVLRLTEPTTLELPGLVRLTLSPGGEGLDAARTAAQRSQQALQEALGALGLQDVRAARARLDARQERERDRRTLDQQLRHLAPEGAASVEQSLLALRAERARAEAELLRQSQPADTALPTEAPALRAAAREAAEAAQEAQEASRAAERHLGAARQALELAQRDPTHAEAQHNDAQRQARDMEARLLAHRERNGEDLALRTRVELERRALEDCRQARTALAAELEQRAPNDVELDRRSAERALDRVQDELRQAEDERRELEGRLGAAGLIGLHDRLEEARARQEAAEEQLGQARADAEAARLLYSTLHDCRQQAQERNLAPLTQEVQALLRAAMPAAKAHFNQELDLTQLDRGEAGAFRFEQLSAGAREQLSLVVRLAMARLLGGDQRLLVVLDDALVSSDEERLIRMGRVLHHAAASSQVLLVTCHWDRMRAQGLDPDQVIDLADERRRQER